MLHPDLVQQKRIIKQFKHREGVQRRAQCGDN